jgi:glycosyltransferase involved in cell wall biosynthesis
MLKNKIHLLICGHDLKFLTPVIKRFESNDDCEVRILLHNGHHITNESEAEDALKWANVIFCEWALGNATWFSQRKRSDQVLVVRLHLQEVQARDRIDFIYSTVWENVDRLILITQHVYDWIRKEFPVLAKRASLVYNPIAAKTTFNLAKSNESRFVLGLVGVVPARKRLDLAVDLLKILHSKDSRYKLRVKGALPYDYSWMSSRKDEMAWYDKVFLDLKQLKEQGAIVFDPHDLNMASWYQSVGHIVSVSDFEGSHQAVAEGMATGAIPVIRDWAGASRIYPDKYVVSTVEEMAEQVLRNSELLSFQAESSFCKSFAQERFDEERVCNQIESIVAHEAMKKNIQYISELEKRILLTTPSVLIVAYIPIGSRSGYRIRVEQEIQILKQQGCLIHLACLVPKINDAGAVSEQATIEHVNEFLSMGCEVSILEVADFFKMHVTDEDFPELTSALLDIVRDNYIDVIHAEALYCARLLPPVKKAAPSLRFSIDWHGALPEESKMGGAHENRIKALEMIEREMLVKADLNIFVSNAMANHYKFKYELPTIDNVIVPCCVTDNRFIDYDDIELNSNSGVSITFAYVGTMTDWQCGQEMIRLFSLLYKRDSRCRFLMLIPTSDHIKVNKYIADYELPNEAYVLKSVTHDEVAMNLATADVAVFLRKNDVVNTVSSPTKFGEYMAAGLPVLMTDNIGDFSAIVREKNVGLCLNYNEIGNLDNPNLTDDMLALITNWASKCASNKMNLTHSCQNLARDSLMWEPSSINWINGYKFHD